MLRGLTTAASGMLTDERYQQMLANNLANMETPGFKASAGESLSFPEQLVMKLNNGPQSGSVIGRLGTGVLFQEGVPVFLEGTVSQTNRNLDVAIVDNTTPGAYAAVSSGLGTGTISAVGAITAGPGGRLTVGGQDVAVVNSAVQAVPGVFAIRNPNYKGGTLYSETGKPDFDANGNPSYLFANAGGNIVGAAQMKTGGWSLRIGQENTMGFHSFYPVAYTADNGQTGIVLTHDGHLDVGANRELVDATGNPILPVGTNGMPIPGGRIILSPAYQGTELFQPDGNPVTDNNGNLSYQAVGANGQAIPGAKLGTVNADITSISPLGQTEFLVGGTFNANAVLANIRAGTGTLKPGQLENSNVDLTYTMTQMMNIVNQYQANQQVVQSEDNLLMKAVDDVGKVNA